MIISNSIVKIVNAFNNFSKSTVDVSWCEIVEWPEKSFHPSHNDETSRTISLTSITYLNNSYSGGRTFFVNDIEVLPKVGRTIYFDGIFYQHGVTPVESGVRYTLPIWYK
jgi:predicted 2-oxoglutarate/Fe(II)-dependent dioxygenase YbiX